MIAVNLLVFCLGLFSMWKQLYKVFGIIEDTVEPCVSTKNILEISAPKPLGVAFLLKRARLRHYQEVTHVMSKGSVSVAQCPLQPHKP